MNHILVIGDIILDVNYYTETTRTAPEKEIPIYTFLREESLLGGAANVAQNIHLFSKDHTTLVELLSVVGNDSEGKVVQQLLHEKGIPHTLWIDEPRQTTHKKRTFCANELVHRMDIEDTFPLCESLENIIMDFIGSRKTPTQAIVLSDYNKGVLTPGLCQRIIQYANDRDILTFVDPKLQNTQKYAGCFCFKPNMKEAQALSNETRVPLIFQKLYETIHPQHIILTDSDKGVFVNSAEGLLDHSKKRNAVDVTGAGDVFLAVLTTAFLETRDLVLSCKMANFIASKSVETVGNYRIRAEDRDEFYLFEMISSRSSPPATLFSKNLSPIEENPDVSSQRGEGDRTSILFSKNNLLQEKETDQLQFLRNLHPRIVFTNGCFDIFHSAHLRLLQYCKDQGGVLVVGLNSDESIRKIKGETRPINPMSERIELLRNLRLVDYIVVFDSETPYQVLQSLRPHLLIKGGDYNVSNIVGREFCEEVKLFSYIEGVSTTNIIQKINDSTM